MADRAAKLDPHGKAVAEGAARVPGDVAIEGSHVKLEPIQVSHIDDLYEAIGTPETMELWRYIPGAAPESKDDFRELLLGDKDKINYAVVSKKTQKAVGVVGWLNVVPANRVIEIGGVIFGKELQRSAAATEVVYLMCVTAFEDCAYRRVEWKCNASNEKSQKAARRFGFEFEGIFRNHMICRGRNRDTAYFSIIEEDWPSKRAAFDAWLHPDNFDASGMQKKTLLELRAQ